MKFVNMTPHPINMMDANNNVVTTFPVSGEIARAEMHEEFIEKIDEIDIYRTKYGKTNIPDPADGVGYIVSFIAAQGCDKSRNDIFVPNGFVRDESGNIIGARFLNRI